MQAGILIALCAAFIFALIDIKKKQVPHKAVRVLAIFAVAYALMTSITAAAVGAVTGFSLTVVMFMLGALGGGDVKLYALLGCFLGASATVRSLIAALFICAAAGLIVLIFKLVRNGKKDILKTQTPFVPFIFLGIAANIFL